MLDDCVPHPLRRLEAESHCPLPSLKPTESHHRTEFGLEIKLRPQTLLQLLDRANPTREGGDAGKACAGRLSPLFRFSFLGGGQAIHI